ncbi:unnamed protein product [Amoebophrya sp. A120]|nr:unnamed protein product [Amoebophrya sp. A120]|eukprot:GSA120T00024317001.1
MKPTTALAETFLCGGTGGGSAASASSTSSSSARDSASRHAMTLHQVDNLDKLHEAIIFRRNRNTFAYPKRFRRKMLSTTSFYNDCSTSNTQNSECQDFRGLFAAKELVPEAMLTCGDVEPLSGNPVDPFRRLHYVKESQSNMWYKCCEQRNEDRFVFNSGPPQLRNEGPWIPGIGPLYGMSRRVQEELKKLTDFGGQIINLLQWNQLTGGLFAGSQAEKILEKAQLATIKTSCVSGKACLGHSFTDQRVKYNMMPARNLRCALMENLKTKVDYFGRRKQTRFCQSFKRSLVEKLLKQVNGLTRTILRKAVSFVPFSTGCRGARFACLQPYDGMGKKYRVNLEEPTCVDTGWKNEPWTFPHNYQVTFL